MFHPSTERLINYWSARKTGGAIPSRASINPGEFFELTPQVFILGRDGPGSYPFRLVGGFVAELHRRDLRGEDVNVGLDDEGLEEDRKQSRKGQRRPFDGRSAFPAVVASAPPEHGWCYIIASGRPQSARLRLR